MKAPASGTHPKQRADARRNRDHLLSSAAATFLREGPRVPMQRIAQAAGVGTGTLYRHFPDRAALLAALGSRAYAAVLRLAQTVRASEAEPLAALRAYLFGTIAQRDLLVLPLHGAPLEFSESDQQLRRGIWHELGLILQAGQAAGTIRADVEVADIVVTGALLAQYLHGLPHAEAAARRSAQVFVDGLRPSPQAGALPPR